MRIENIVAEIEASPVDWFELHADNLTADREYALKLFKALTPLFKRLLSENRLLTEDWSKYDGANAVFEPTHMRSEQLELGADRFWREISQKKPIRSSFKNGPDNNPGNSRRGVDAKVSGSALTIGYRVFRWKSIIALGVIGAGLWFEWYWIWGALLVAWAITDLRNQRTYLLDDIPRSESPVLYWIVVLMWLLLGLWALSTSPMITQLLDTITNFKVAFKFAINR
jgi:hypothetical protein